MNKNVLIVVLILILGLLIGYFVGKNAVSKNEQKMADRNEQIVIPQLYARFNKVSGFTPIYSAHYTPREGSYVVFDTTKEILDYAKTHPIFSTCNENVFGRANNAVVKKENDQNMPSYTQIDLGNDYYFNFHYRQDACWSGTPTPEESLFLQNQMKLLEQFLQTAERNI